MTMRAHFSADNSKLLGCLSSRTGQAILRSGQISDVAGSCSGRSQGAVWLLAVPVLRYSQSQKGAV